MKRDEKETAHTRAIKIRGGDKHTQQSERQTPTQKKDDETWKQEPVSYVLGGRQRTQTRGVPQAEAKNGLHAAAQHERLKAATERTMVRAEADALTAASTHGECVLVRGEEW